MKSEHSKPEIPETLLMQWQALADILAKICQVPAALIMKVHSSEIEVFVCSHADDNPYERGEKAPLNTGLYCEEVMRRRDAFLVPDALQDPKWDHNPDIKLGMISYLGYPLIWPDGEVFGTLCILDKKENPYSSDIHELMRRFREVVETSMAFLWERERRRLSEDKLRKAHDELEFRVQERTAELDTKNQELEQQIVARKRVEEELLSHRQGLEILIEERTKELKESEQRYRAVFDNAGIGIDLLDRDGRILQVNQSLLDMLGYSEEELRQLTFLDITHPEEKEISKLNLEALMAGEIYSYRLEKRYLRKDRSIFWADLTTTAVRGPNGEYLGTIGVISDITDRKKAEEALRNSEERFRMIYENAPVMMDAFDENGRCTMWNKECEKTFGWTIDEINSHDDPLSLFFPDPKIRERVKETVTSSPEKTFSEWHPQTKEGVVRTCRWANFALPDGTVMNLGYDITDRKKAEEALRESEERYRTFFDTSRDGVFMTRMDGQFIDFNDVALDVLGYGPDDRDELLKTNVANVYANPEEREAHAALVANQGYSKEYPAELLKRDGTVIHTLITTVARKDLYGIITGFQGNVRDITERKRAEEELENTLNRFYTILSSLYAAVLLVGDEGQVEFANQAFCDLFDLDDAPSDLRGLGAVEMIKKIQDAYAHPAEAVARIQAVVAQQLPVRGEEIAMRGCKTYMVDFIPILIDGKCYGRLWHHQDITDRKRAEQKLMDSEERFRLSAESLSDVIYEWDLGSSVKWFGNIDGLLGYGPGEFPNTLEAWTGILHPDDRDRVWKAVEKQLSDEATYDIEYRVQHKEGGWRYWVARGKVVKDTGGKPLRWIGAVTDITDRKRTEELALQSARLRAVADLSSGVAHHFNNLLQIVMASTSLSLADLESGDLSEIKTNLQKMLQAATLGAETVKRLQTFANIRADVTVGEAAVFDMANTARNAAEISKPLWKSDPEKKGIKIDLQLDLQDGCLLKGQENEMFEVLVNLIRNAAEAMPQGGDIEVKAYSEADEVVITVADTGTGIAKEDLPKVFQPFWSSKGVGIGKGMGLAVTHGLVKRHGGSTSVDSKVGVGTTFTIRLPLAQEPVTKTEQSSTSTSGDHLRILVIDDDVNIASLLERICAKEGHTVYRPLSGQEGLEIFNKEPVDLVMSDLGMPGMNGWDVGKAIRSICQENRVSKPPFILLTGYGGQELEKDKISESGVNAVVAKPIDRATVLATVQEIAGRFSIGTRVP